MNRKNKEINYWLVGADWNGEDKKPEFYKGYWKMGYSDTDKPKFTKLRNSMEKDDRIAIKAMGGKGSKEIIIYAIGIIKGRTDDNQVVLVDWIVKDIRKKVAKKNKWSTIHKLNNEKDYIKEIFVI